ncbi:MAG: hypothetical protein PUC00_03010 [Clostridiales bacterium]|nr:hypothetical protein [Clostridiales bacterium]
MKKLLALAALLLMLMPLHVLAEETPSGTALQALYPNAQIITQAEDADDAFYVLDMGEDRLKLCYFRLTEDGWTLALDSDTAIRPYVTQDAQPRVPYTSLELLLAEDTLSILYRRTVYSWRYDFARDEAGQWQFVRLHIADEGNGIDEELTYQAGCVVQIVTRSERMACTPPCPMPWLADCATLAGFDASAFPEDLCDLDEETLTRVAALLLPEYTFLDGKFSTEAVTLLMRNPAGNVVFLGGVYREDGWVWTESTPLPEDTECDSFHTGAGWMEIGIPHPDGLMSRWDEEFPLYVDYGISLQEDGRWLVHGFLNGNEDYVLFESEGLYLSYTGMVFGRYDLERDITRIDWSDYVYAISDALSLLSKDWGVINDPSLPLYADAEASILLAEYRCATPVHVLAYSEDETEPLALVEIADSGVTGWLPAYGLLLGGEQAWEIIETDKEGEWRYWETAAYVAPTVELRAGTQIYDAPEGELLWSLQGGGYVLLLSDYGNGWLHVGEVDALSSGFVRAADCIFEE